MKSVYLVGIGGAGMSGLARYFSHEGYEVYGADPGESETTRALEEDIGATIYHEHKAQNIPSSCKYVIYSPAVPSDNQERVYAQEHGIQEYSYPEYLGLISQDKKTIAVTGTNGKTTTTSMIATVLDELGFDPTVIVGGDMPRFGSNFRAGSSEYFVVEACEYKESFLHIQADIVVITNITPDHLDYFGTSQNYINAYRKFIQSMNPEGVVVANLSDSALGEVLTEARERDIRLVDYTQYTYNDWNLKLPGAHNIFNAAAALTACIQLGVEKDGVQRILEEDFQATNRRFQLLGMSAHGALVYDDYAHNPEALGLLIDALHSSFPKRKVVMIFQPHLYSRTQDFFDDFVTVLQEVDYLYLLPIYPAREQEKDFKVSSLDLQKAIEDQNSSSEVYLVASVEEAIRELEQAEYTNDYIIVTAGAGRANQAGKALVT